MGRFLGYGRQTIEEDDIAAVVDVLRGDFLTQGPHVERFEAEIAARSGARHAIAVSSGTAALHIACLAAGAGPGVAGVTQPLTFAATANALLYCGATLDLVDVDAATLMMSPERLAAHLSKHPDTRIILPVSYSGLSSQGAALRAAAGNRILIEDASHSFGAENETGKRVGAGDWADMTVFSFHPVKPITTGEGGAVVTNDDDLAHKLRLLRSHGIEREASRLVDPSQASNPWFHEQQILGYNYRLCDIQAALGASQAAKIDRLIARRRAIAVLYDTLLVGAKNLRAPVNDPAQRARSGHHLYPVLIDFERIGKTRAQVMQALREKGIGTQVHYIPVHQHPYHRSVLGDRSGHYPVSEAYYAQELSIPCFPGMSDDEVRHVAQALLDIVG